MVSAVCGPLWRDGIFKNKKYFLHYQGSQTLSWTCVQQTQCLEERNNVCNFTWCYTQWPIFFRNKHALIWRSELPLPLVDVTHPGLAAVDVDTFWFTPTSERWAEWRREKHCLDPLIKMLSMMQIQTFLCMGLGCAQLYVFFLLCIKKAVFLHICNPWLPCRECVIKKMGFTPPPHPSPSLLTTLLCFSLSIVFVCVCVYFVCHLSQGCILMSDVCFLCICKIAFHLLWWSVDTDSSSSIKISSLWIVKWMYHLQHNKITWFGRRLREQSVVLIQVQRSVQLNGGSS